MKCKDCKNANKPRCEVLEMLVDQSELDQQVIRTQNQKIEQLESDKKMLLIRIDVLEGSIQ